MRTGGPPCSDTPASVFDLCVCVCLHGLSEGDGLTQEYVHEGETDASSSFLGCVLRPLCRSMRMFLRCNADTIGSCVSAMPVNADWLNRNVSLEV